MITKKYIKKDINVIANSLLNKEIIAFPTDTVFGLACIINKDAIKKVYDAKGRSFSKPLPMMCNSLEMIESVAVVTKDVKKIINKYFPGALTIVFNKKDCLEDYVTNNKSTIAIRMPNDSWILELISKINSPILVTSANVSDSGSLTKWEDVYNQLNNKIDGIVCEDSNGNISSTIIDVSNGINLLRQGPISLEDIINTIKE